jgi:hypothetical protein
MADIPDRDRVFDKPPRIPHRLFRIERFEEAEQDLRSHLPRRYVHARAEGGQPAEGVAADRIADPIEEFPPGGAKRDPSRDRVGRRIAEASHRRRDAGAHVHVALLREPELGGRLGREEFPYTLREGADGGQITVEDPCEGVQSGERIPPSRSRSLRYDLLANLLERGHGIREEGGAALNQEIGVRVFHQEVPSRTL